MNIRESLIFVVGLIMLVLGTLLVTNTLNGGFFVFPFFFFGDTTFAPFLVIISLTIMVIFFWWANSQYPDDTRISKDWESRRGVLKIGSICKFCGSPMPEDASFCSSCGSIKSE
ncbi:MAG: zinc ribbon domain-containing protein [Candidatus Thorarchaeota archaeon]|jgi:uncharacterized membrane protein